MFSYSRFNHNYSKSAFKYEEAISKDYRVFVNGEEIPVYTCRISKYPFNRPWPGHQREINQTELASFVNIVSDEEIKVEVIINKDYENVMIRPYSKGISHEECDGKISFALKQEGQFVLATDNFHNCLYIFNSRPIECPKPETVTYYFGAGIHMPGKIVLNDNESVYVDKDALVFGCVFAENAKNIRVFGNGLLDDSAEERFYIHCYEDFTNGNIKLYDCENVKVEGVLFRNSAIWCVNVFHCFDVELDNIKVFGQWRYNTDGVDIVNSQNVTLKNSFIHSFDDAVTIKGIDRYINTNNEKIMTENCVLWCDWGKTCELGLETACREYKDITFRNCDIIRGGNTALDIQNGDCAEISNILYENINVEYNSFDNYPMLQETDESQYGCADKMMVPELISIRNCRFRAEDYCDDVWKVPKDIAPVDLSGVQQATVHDVEFKNINVYYDEKIPKVDNKFNVPIVIDSDLDDVEHYNICISGIRVNGVEIDKENAILKIENVKNFSFEKSADEFVQMKKNTVDSSNQLNDSALVKMENPAGKGIRVMFAGNSITLHGAKKDIGWENEWGMAASAKEKDYVHLLMSKIKENKQDAAFCICQVAEWESNYKNGGDKHYLFKAARDFNADVIIARFIENCPGEDFDEALFKKEYDNLITYLNKSGKAKVILTTGFWKHPGDEIIREFALEHNYSLVELGDLGENDDMMAKNLFWHSGVAMHPGDKGMQAIAERILEKL